MGHCISRRKLCRVTILFAIVGLTFFGYYYRSAIRGKVSSLTKDFNWSKSVPVNNTNKNNSKNVQPNQKHDAKTAEKFNSTSRKSNNSENFAASTFEYDTYEVVSWTENPSESESKDGFYETGFVEKVLSNESKSVEKVLSDDSNRGSEEDQQ